MMADWKRAHANAAEHALKHPLVRDVMQEFLGNIGRPDGALERYGLTKVASYAAQVARAEALGIDPDVLRADAAEIDAHMRAIIDAAYRAGKPVIVVAPKEGRPRRCPEGATDAESV
jgi:hypothetical protein